MDSTATRELSELVTNTSDTTPKYQNWESEVGVPPQNQYFKSFERYEFSYEEQQNLIELIGLVESQGFIELTGTKHKQLIDDLTKLHQKWSRCEEAVSFTYHTEVYISQASNE